MAELIWAEPRLLKKENAKWKAYGDRFKGRINWWAWVDLNHRPRPYQGLLWCYMHSSFALSNVLMTPFCSTRRHRRHSFGRAAPQNFPVGTLHVCVSGIRFAASVICETDVACVAEILLEGAAIRPRPWIESPSQRDPGIARIL
jgi:hypothetical protein